MRGLSQVRVRVPGVRRAADGGSLHQYRLFFLDGAGHVAAPPYPFEADTDETAIKLAKGMREGRRVELWCGTRLIRRWT